MLEDSRVIRVLNCLPGGKQSAGGEEMLAANIANKWKNHSIEPVILYPNYGKMWRKFQDANVALIDFDIKGWRDWNALRRIEKIAREYKVDIIQTHGPGFSELLFGIAARRLAVPWVATRPNIMSLLYGRSKIRQWIYRIVDHYSLAGAKNIVCLSDFGIREARRMSWVSKDNTEVIFNGVNVERFWPGSHADLGSNQYITIGMVGALLPIKGWFDFLQVIKQVYCQQPNIRALIVGDGPLKSALAAEINKLGLARVVELTGWQDDVTKTLAKMDIFLFTSYSEGMAVSILEAMSCGLPVVCTSVGAAPEQIAEEENGYLVAPGDVDGMASKCLELIASPELRRTMGQLSRSIVMDKFSEEKMVGKYATLYHSICTRNLASADKAFCTW